MSVALFYQVPECRRTAIVAVLGVIRLLLFHCAIVVYENKGVLILRIVIPLCTFIARAEVALMEYQNPPALKAGNALGFTPMVHNQGELSLKMLLADL